jgi:hypothetical protein
MKKVKWYAILWKKKWEAREEAKNFVAYFIAEYLDNPSNTGWFEGAAPGAPSTNNCLEATNNVIKKEWTLRDRLRLRDFMDTAFSKLHNWSTEHIPNCPNTKVFSLTPTYSLALQTEAFQWAKSDAQLRRQQDTSRLGVVKFYVQPGNQHRLKDQDLSTYDRQQITLPWRNFDSYVKAQSRLWYLEMTDDDWEKATCTCPIFLKQYVCKHILGIAIRLKMYSIPDVAKSVPIGEKRKRGRPALAKKALLRQ